jgi:hypothetical protein
MHDVVEVPLGLRVESGGGLVEKEQLGSADYPHSDIETTTLTTGESADLLIGVVVETNHRDQLVDVVGPLSLRCRVGLLVAPQMVEEIVGRPSGMVPPRLEDYSNSRPPVFTRSGRVGPEDAGVAGRRLAEAFEDLDAGGLARPVGPEERHHLTAADLEIDTVEHVGRAVSHAQSADLDDWGS